MLRSAVIVVCCVLIISSLSFGQSDSSDSLTITTYYPAPYGVYKNLKLHRSQEPTGAAVDEGVMYYDQNEHVLRYRNQTQWVNVTGPTCKLVNYADGDEDTGCGPGGWYTASFAAKSESGQILCCKISSWE